MVRDERIRVWGLGLKLGLVWLVLASRLGARGLGFRILWIELGLGLGLGLGFTVYSLGFKV